MKSLINRPPWKPSAISDRRSVLSSRSSEAGRISPFRFFKCQVSSFKFARAGFTLVELLAVITVITILAALVVGGASYALHKASIARCNVNMEAIKNAIADYQMDFGSCPQETSENGLFDALTGAGKYSGGKRYLKDATCVRNYPTTSSPAQLVDPWGNLYKYQAPGVHNVDSYDLWSCGPNGQDDSAHGGGDDIANWTPGQ